MTNKNYTKPKVMITETRTYKLWESAGRKIVEAQLTPDQIKQIFQGAQDIETGGGNNRTMIGKGKDAASAVGKAWEDLKTKAQTSKPIDGFEKKYDAIAGRLKQATGGDQGAMKYVQKYRDFAKKHPIAQGVIYAALIAAIGLSGAGVGGAAALGLFKMTDKLLQGEKFTSAAYSGVKTGALAYGASQLAQYFQKPNVPLPDNIESVKLPSGTDYIVKQGDTLSQIAEKYGVSVEELMKANNGATTVTPTGQSMTWDDPNALSNVNAMGDATPSGTGVQQNYDVKTAPKVSNPDRINVGQKLNIPGATGSSPYQGGVGTAADTWDKIGAGKYPYDQISANQAAKYGIDTGGLGDASKAGGKIASDAAGPSQSMIDQMRNQNLFKMQDQADAAYYADKPDDVGINPRNNDAVGTGMPGSAQDTTTPGSNTVSGLTPEQRANPAFQDAYQKVMQQYADQPMRRGIRQKAIEAGKEALAALANAPVNESVQLSESQIFLLIGKIVERQRRIDEGIMDTIKGAAGKTAAWARTKGQNLTTKITADKLLQAWKKADSPTDSDAVAKVMIGAGVPQETVDNLMKNFIQGPSAGTNTNVWQGADRSIPAYQRKQQGQSFAAKPNASGQTPTPQGQTPAPAPQGQLPAPQGQTQEPTQDNLPLRYYGAGNKSPTDFWGRKRPVQPTMQSQQRQAALDAANAAATTSTTSTTPTTTPAPQGTTYDPTNAAANRLAKGQAAQQQAIKQMAATKQANSPVSQQYSSIKAAADAALAKPGFERTAADKLAIKQAAANNIIQMPKNTTTAPTTKVAEGEFAGHYATGVAGQWRNKGPKANKPATIGDLVGESEENKNNKEDRFSRFMDRKYKKSEEVGRVNNPPIKGTPNTAKTGYYPTPKPPVKKLDTPLANETVSEDSHELTRILHIAGIRK
jgi:LysM repeat protein